MGFILAALSILLIGITQQAYAHSSEPTGCVVGGPCVEITANSPIFIMFAVIGAGGVIMLAYYGRQDQRKKLGAIFNF